MFVRQGTKQIPLLRGTTVRRTVAALLATFFLAGCTSGPGSQDEFVDVLMRDDAFTENEATCIADAVFDEYAADEDALGKISGAESYEFLTGEDGVAGFDDFLTETVTGCTSVGPQPDS